MARETTPRKERVHDDYKKLFGLLIQGPEKFILSLLRIANTEEERDRIKTIYERYQNLPALARRGSPKARNLVCKALYNRSYFNCPRTTCPIDKFFDRKYRKP